MKLKGHNTETNIILWIQGRKDGGKFLENADTDAVLAATESLQKQVDKQYPMPKWREIMSCSSYTLRFNEEEKKSICYNIEIIECVKDLVDADGHFFFVGRTYADPAGNEYIASYSSYVDGGIYLRHHFVNSAGANTWNDIINPTSEEFAKMRLVAK